MNQKDLSFFYRGVLLFIAGSVALAALSKVHQPWAKNAGAIGGITLFIAGAAFSAVTAFRQFTTFLRAPTPGKPVPESLYLDNWCRLARLAVATSVLLTVIAATIFLLVEPPKQCPNWHLPGQRPIPWWFLFMVTALLHAGLIFVVVRWKWLIRKAIESVNYPTTVPVSYTLVATVLGGCGVAQFPWIGIFRDCFF